MSGRRGNFFILALCAIVLCLAGSILINQGGEDEIFQDQISLGGMKYDEELLSEAAKLPGIRSLFPILELNVRLKVGDYTKDTVLLGVDLEELSYQAKASREIAVGTNPVLLLGEKSLASLSDINGHAISEDQQKKYLEDYENLEIFLSFPTENGERWLPCVIAGVLKTPAEDIYLPYTQAQSLGQEYGLDLSIGKALLTIKGKANREQALRCFSGGNGN